MRKLLIDRRLKSNGGAEGSRTPDLLIANETLYQLSYDPIHQRLAMGNLGKPAANSAAIMLRFQVRRKAISGAPDILTK